MKATMVGFEIASVALLMHLLGLLGLPRERILIYAWHPLALWEFAGSGHIDAAVITFVALALWARQREAAWLTGTALAAAALVKFFPVAIVPALYRRWDWKMPAAAAAVVLVAYLPFLGASRSVFGFLPGYLSEEGLQSGSGFFLWNLLTSVVPGLEDLGIALYLAFAAAALASLAIYALMGETGDSRYLATAMALAVAMTVLVSPHYPWYFAWLVPFLCFRPVPSVLYLTVASPLLYFVPGGLDPEGARTAFEAAIYGPFALLACLELRHHLAARAGANWIEAQT